MLMSCEFFSLLVAVDVRLSSDYLLFFIMGLRNKFLGIFCLFNFAILVDSYPFWKLRNSYVKNRSIKTIVNSWGANR